MHPYDLIRRPVVSEKNTMLMEQGQYSFEVSPNATKQQVKEAVETIFKVRVLTVNTVSVHAKERMKRRRGGRPIAGHTQSWKKAVVKLAPGDSIDIFEGV